MECKIQARRDAMESNFTGSYALLYFCGSYEVTFPGAGLVRTARLANNAGLFSRYTENMKVFLLYFGGGVTAHMKGSNISGNTASSAVFVRGPSSVRISNCSFSDNVGTTGAAFDASGARAQLDIHGSRLYNNTAWRLGGAVHAFHDATVNIVHSQLHHNKAVAYCGGAVTAGHHATVAVQESYIGDNAAGSCGPGGGVYGSSSMLHFNNSVMVYNSATAGGAVWAGDADAHIVMDNCLVADNYVYYSEDMQLTALCSDDGITKPIVDPRVIESGWGGGVGVDMHATASINNTEIANNTAWGDAGGVLVARYANLTLDNVTISGNVAGRRGGVPWSLANQTRCL